MKLICTYVPSIQYITVKQIMSEKCIQFCNIKPHCFRNYSSHVMIVLIYDFLWTDIRINAQCKHTRIMSTEIFASTFFYLCSTLPKTLKKLCFTANDCDSVDVCKYVATLSLSHSLSISVSLSIYLRLFFKPSL